MRVFVLLVLLVLGPLGAATPVAAQPSEGRAQVEQGRGRAVLVNWPASLGRLHDNMGRKAPYLLPKIDTLSLDYRYAATDSSSQWSFVLEWMPGAQVLYEGAVLPRRRAPRGLRMVNVEVRAEVQVDGRYVGDMIVAVDSMALAPSPSLYSFEVSVPHDRVFLDVPADTARRALRRGATLQNLVVERMGFAAAATSTSERRRPPGAGERRSTPRSGPSIYTPSPRILIGWRVAPRPYHVGTQDGARTVTARRAATGRTPAPQAAPAPPADRGERETEASGDGGRSADSGETQDERDEDDDTSLRLPALGAAAAVGLVAVAGGTVGLYGRGDTPIGLAAGYTQPRGGVHLQAAVNRAVIEDAPRQKLTLKALGFYDVFSSRIQPAVGLGFQVDPAREPSVRPSVSLGLAANTGRVVLFGGVDVVQATPEVGLVYNFRARGRTGGDR